MNKIELIKKWEKWNCEKYQRKISRRKLLHNNSVELIKVLEGLNIIKDGISVFELGCGCGRNLSYIYNANNSIDIMGNDLVKEECFRYMDNIVKDNIIFFEKDTETLLNDECFNVDLLITSDHFMHVHPDSMDSIIDNILNKWKPKIILLREPIRLVVKTFPKFMHDYSKLDEKYKMIYNKISDSHKDYKISVFCIRG